MKSGNKHLYGTTGLALDGSIGMALLGFSSTGPGDRDNLCKPLDIARRIVAPLPP